MNPEKWGNNPEKPSILDKLMKSFKNDKPRTFAQIVDDINSDPGNVLEVLNNLDDDEIETLGSTEFLIDARQIKKEAHPIVVGYLIGISHAMAMNNDEIKKLHARCDMLMGMLNVSTMTKHLISKGFTNKNLDEFVEKAVQMNAKPDWEYEHELEASEV